jgi:hypothetical protein
MSRSPGHRVFKIKFSSVYPLYIQKGERKSRTREEVDRVIWASCAAFAWRRSTIP